MLLKEGDEFGRLRAWVGWSLPFFFTIFSTPVLMTTMTATMSYGSLYFQGFYFSFVSCIRKHKLHVKGNCSKIKKKKKSETTNSIIQMKATNQPKNCIK